MTVLLEMVCNTYQYNYMWYYMCILILLSFYGPYIDDYAILQFEVPCMPHVCVNDSFSSG